ncbi:unnamed protein product [Diatraea saccharalis]|uniref:Uncharacterized protein n=1 Tax=Diatraea saccharalis TaxID=40085 RepID=A0A9N9WHE8_9NEOP|nr:unnamed protein product [Diatraea saccharalis]
MNSPCFATSPYIFHPVSESSATESEDSENSGREKTVDGGNRTKKYTDPKRRTINKVSKKILKAIEKLTCNIKKHKKAKKVVEPTPVRNGNVVYLPIYNQQYTKLSKIFQTYYNVN